MTNQEQRNEIDSKILEGKITLEEQTKLLKEYDKLIADAIRQKMNFLN